MRDGREFHVYGSGKDRTVVSLPLAASTRAADTKAAHAEATGGASAPAT